MSNSTISSRKKMQKLMDELTRTCHFSKPEIECLIKNYQSLLPKKKHQGNEDVFSQKLGRSSFRDILHQDFDITDDIIMDRIFKAFDEDNDGKISMKEWVKGMSVFLRGTDQEKIKFCFGVYDMNGDGYITKDEMFHCLKSCFQSGPSVSQEEDPEEGIKDITDVILKKLDVDQDVKVSLQDFTLACTEEPLLIESLGPVLPKDEKIRAFEQTFTLPAH